MRPVWIDPHSRQTAATCGKRLTYSRFWLNYSAVGFERAACGFMVYEMKQRWWGWQRWVGGTHCVGQEKWWCRTRIMIMQNRAGTMLCIQSESMLCDHSSSYRSNDLHFVHYNHCQKYFATETKSSDLCIHTTTTHGHRATLKRWRWSNLLRFAFSPHTKMHSNCAFVHYHKADSAEEIIFA